MSTGLVDVAKERKERPSGSETRRHGRLVRIAEDVAEDADVLASLEKSSMAEIISNAARPIIKKRLATALRKRLEGGKS